MGRNEKAAAKKAEKQMTLRQGRPETPYRAIDDDRELDLADREITYKAKPEDVRLILIDPKDKPSEENEERIAAFCESIK